MTFTNLQTAYDRQLPDEPESTPLTYDSISNDNLWYIAEKLAELVADGKNLSWMSNSKEKAVTSVTVDISIAETQSDILELFRQIEEGLDAGGYLNDKRAEAAKQIIRDEIDYYGELPLGYDWSDFI